MKVIAESAFNHNGDPEEVIKLANASKNAGADFFAIQIYHCDSFCVSDYSKYHIYKDCEISHSSWKKIFDHCSSIDLSILPCVLDETSFKFAYECGFRFFKIHATDITNRRFLELMATYVDTRFFLETQCATLYDIRMGLAYLKGRVECVVHGFSNYPTDYVDLNLGALKHMQNEFNLPVGLADHSLDTLAVPAMALAMGCTYLEKHITISRANRNFDWQVSLNPEEFQIMVSNLSLYRKAMGIGVKHPVKSELHYRTIMYKKIIPGSDLLKRSDTGMTYIESVFKSFDRNQITAAVIARLKSKRLKNKVLLPIGENSVISNILNRVGSTAGLSNVVLATSDLVEDQPLVDEVEKSGFQVFRGHPVSVLDRLLSLAEQQKVGAIFRVTGDNLFTDPGLMDQMIRIFHEDNLDYVRVNNVPFGVSCELFSTAYLWSLYLDMENPMESEYLTWFVINDGSARKGCIDFVDKNTDSISRVNLSIDYEDDFVRCQKLFKKIHKNFTDIKLGDIISEVELSDLVDESKEIKLPGGKSVIFGDYMKMLNEQQYVRRYQLTRDDISNW